MTESGLVLLWAGGDERWYQRAGRMIAKGYEFLFEGVLKLTVVMVVQMHKYAKTIQLYTLNE